MTLHITKRIEIYDDNHQDSVYIEENKEFDTLEFTVGKSWRVEGSFEIHFSKEFTGVLIKAIEDNFHI